MAKQNVPLEYYLMKLIFYRPASLRERMVAVILASDYLCSIAAQAKMRRLPRSRNYFTRRQLIMKKNASYYFCTLRSRLPMEQIAKGKTHLISA
jgi:hypothetical protein